MLKRDVFLIWMLAVVFAVGCAPMRPKGGGVKRPPNNQNRNNALDEARRRDDEEFQELLEARFRDEAALNALTNPNSFLSTNPAYGNLRAEDIQHAQEAAQIRDASGSLVTPGTPGEFEFQNPNDPSQGDAAPMYQTSLPAKAVARPATHSGKGSSGQSGMILRRRVP